MTSPGPLSEITQRLLSWFQSQARDLPWRRATGPYAIWVSEIMLQQTQVKTVIPYWKRWMRALPSLKRLAEADSNTLHKLWEGLGYYTRVRNMRAAARLIIERHAGRFPRTHAQVLALPGIGPYTAGAICSIAFNQPTPILDGNVIRVLTRLFGVFGDPSQRHVRDQLWDLAARLVSQAGQATPSSPGAAPRRLHSEFNQALMELGALVCLPRAPLCPECPVRALCVARHSDRVRELPQSRRRPPPTARRFLAFVLHRKNRYLVRQRPRGVVNAHLWEFPNVETSETDPVRVARGVGLRARRLAPMVTIKHSITRYRIQLHVYQGEHAAASLAGARWRTLEGLRQLPFASAHKKILDGLDRQQSITSASECAKLDDQ